MTVGIATSGPMAGLAAYRALRAVEALGRGAIGGFVSFVAIANGRLLTADTQRGGALALFDGTDPPDEIAQAPLAGLMSSGPDRPEPLIQFSPADPAIGIVTGHRLPNMPAPEGIGPPNLYARSLMANGSSPAEAVAQTLERVPAADAGLIAMDLAGTIALGNSALVAARDDIGQVLEHCPRTGLRIGLLHNSIFPVQGLVGAAMAAAFDAPLPRDAAPNDTDVLGTAIVSGPRRALSVDPQGRAVVFTRPDAETLDTGWEGSAALRGDPVICDGSVIGEVVREVYCTTRNRIVTGGRGGNTVGWRPVTPAN